MVTPVGRPTELARFAALVGATPVPLGEAAIAVAAYLGHADDPATELRRLDDLAEAVDGDELAAVVHHLFTTEGLRGDQATYYDPANSMLPAVLDRRLGIPITLAIVVVDVSRRLAIDATVVGMPGHVLVGDGDPPQRWIDTFAGGEWLDAEGAQARFAAMGGRRPSFHPRFLAVTPDDQVVARLLANLVGIYTSDGDAHRLLRVLELRSAIIGIGERERPQRAHALAAVGRLADAADLWEVEAAARLGDEADAMTAKVEQLRANLN